MDTNAVTIKFYKYGDTLHSVSRNTVYKIKTLCPNGTVLETEGTMYSSMNAIWMFKSDEALGIMKALYEKQGTGELAFYIVNKERPIEHYSFTLETSNFNALYDTVKYK